MNYIDIKKLTLDELAGVVNLYPWFGGARKELCERMSRMGGDGWGESQYADAAIEINNCFRSAQNAAEQYLNEIKAIREETEAERQRILAQAQAEAENIVAAAKKDSGEHDPAKEPCLEENMQSHSDNG